MIAGARTVWGSRPPRKRNVFFHQQLEVRKIELTFAPEVGAKDRPAIVGTQTKVEFDRTTLHYEQETRRAVPFPSPVQRSRLYIAAPNAAAPAKSA